MAKAAKKAPKRVQANQPATEPRGSADGEATKTLPQSAAEDLTTHNAPDQLRLIQLLVDSAGRTFRALEGLLKQKKTHLRVLAWITWLFLLALFGGFAVVLIVLVFRWHPLYTIVLIGLSTGLAAGTNLVNRLFRRMR